MEGYYYYFYYGVDRKSEMDSIVVVDTTGSDEQFLKLLRKVSFKIDTFVVVVL
jgi:hypothetical protein